MRVCGRGRRSFADLGGLHRFMSWDGPILTDSGGFQVFSLAELRKIDDEQVVFQSHIDGSLLELSPESAMRIQEQLGADCIMCLDECPPHDVATEKLAARRRPDDALGAALPRCAAAGRSGAVRHRAGGDRSASCGNDRPRGCCRSISPATPSAG